MLQTIQNKIEQVQTASNMVAVESILSSITQEYLTKYRNEVEICPKADNCGSQSVWASKAVRYFIADIHADKLTVWQNIPERFKNTAIYQRLKLSQFVTSK